MTALSYVVSAGALAALLDIALAMGFWWVRAGVPPQRILQSVASGVLGNAAYTMGAASAVLGACLHLGIACAMAAAYWRISRRLELMQYRWVESGLMYGAGLYVVMTFVVVPLSRATAAPFSPAWFVASVFAHLGLVGLTLAWMARARH